MLNRRRKPIKSAFLSLAFYRSIDFAPVDRSSFAVLGLVQWFSLTFNQPAKVEHLRTLGRFSPSGLQQCIEMLLNAGFVCRSGIGEYLVTDSGEYYLRGIETQLTRLMDQSKLARWKPIKSPDDPRYKYLRAPNVKGVKKY